MAVKVEAVPEKVGLVPMYIGIPTYNPFREVRRAGRLVARRVSGGDETRPEGNQPRTGRDKVTVAGRVSPLRGLGDVEATNIPGLPPWATNLSPLTGLAGSSIPITPGIACFTGAWADTLAAAIERT